MDINVCREYLEIFQKDIEPHLENFGDHRRLIECLEEIYIFCTSFVSSHFDETVKRNADKIVKRNADKIAMYYVGNKKYFKRYSSLCDKMTDCSDEVYKKFVLHIVSDPDPTRVNYMHNYKTRSIINPQEYVDAVDPKCLFGFYHVISDFIKMPNFEVVDILAENIDFVKDAQQGARVTENCYHYNEKFFRKISEKFGTKMLPFVDKDSLTMFHSITEEEAPAVLEYYKSCVCNRQPKSFFDSPNEKTEDEERAFSIFVEAYDHNYATKWNRTI